MKRPLHHLAGYTGGHHRLCRRRQQGELAGCLQFTIAIAISNRRTFLCLNFLCSLNQARKLSSQYLA